VLKQNKGVIVDPISAKCYGVAAELETQLQKRKNFAFYDGYTRVDCDIGLEQINNAESVGAGVMIRLSDNIEIYPADLDTIGIFDTTILSGAEYNRIIYPINDSMVHTMSYSGQGIWVKGLNGAGKKNWYLGITPVRLPFEILTNRIGKGFKLHKWENISNDPEGTLVGGPEGSILKVYERINHGEKIDTVKNSCAPEVMLHGQKRIIEYDSSYFFSDSLLFRLQMSEEDEKKMWLEDRSDYGVTIVDSAITVKDVRLLAIQVKKFLRGEKEVQKPVNVIETKVHSRKIVLSDAVDGVLRRTTMVNKLLPVFIEKYSEKLLLEEDRGVGVEIKITPGIEVYGTNNVSNKSNCIWPHFDDIGNRGSRTLTYFAPWSTFNLLTSRPAFYILPYHGDANEELTFSRVIYKNGNRVVDKPEKVALYVEEKLDICITVDTDESGKTYDFWIPNTEGGYNDKWVIRITRDDKPIGGQTVELNHEEAYENYNKGTDTPVFMDIHGNEIRQVTSDENGMISNLRFGFENGQSGRVGDVYRLKIRIKGTIDWVKSEERDYLGVYDKIMLDKAIVFCNNDTIEDWTGRSSTSANPITVTDAVPYSFGCKDDVAHFNEDMRDWMAVMDAAVKSTNPNASWNVTTADNNVWANYYINTSNTHAQNLPQQANCYRPRLRRTLLDRFAAGKYPKGHPKYWAGIDCSGFVQRTASGHTELPDLQSRATWTNYVDSSKSCYAIISTYSTLVGSPNLKTFNRIAPGDIIIKGSHVAIIQYVTGIRGGQGPDKRNKADVHLIQAMGGEDVSSNEGRVTDVWDWSMMPNSNAYRARRLNP